jgi:hypothetical protein
MRRMLLAACASSMLALAVPSLASAHHGKCHHHHHACSHVRHAHHARVLKFGAALSTSTTSPSAPVSEETAGKVAKFEGGVLTITLNDGSTVSGKVTERAQIRCESATSTESSDDDDQGDDNSGDGDSSHSSVRLGSRGDDMSAGEDDGDDDGGQASPCTSAALVAGTTVREAELSIGGGGAVWEHIDLIQ